MDRGVRSGGAVDDGPAVVGLIERSLVNGSSCAGGGNGKETERKAVHGPPWN